MNILAVGARPEHPQFEVRLGAPLRLLCAQRGWMLLPRAEHDCAPADLAQADLLVLQRGSSRRAWQLELAMRRRGGRVVFDIDDLLTDVPPHISLHRPMQQRAAWLRRCMDAAELLTVSTPRLADALRADGLQDGPPMAVVPNHAQPLPPGAALPLADAVQPASLVLASADRLDAPWLWPALRAAIERLASQGLECRVLAVGPAGEDVAAAGLPCTRLPMLPRQAFVQQVRSLPNPVGVIPLEAGRFAACKSAVKWFDYAEAGIPTLCSAVPPYADVIDSGRTGWLVDNDAGAWEAALTAVVSQPALRTAVAAAAQAQVRQAWSLEQSAQAWQQAIAQLMARPPAPGPQPGAIDRLRMALEVPLSGLRQLNRRRLERRHGNPPGG